MIVWRSHNDSTSLSSTTKESDCAQARQAFLINSRSLWQRYPRLCDTPPHCHSIRAVILEHGADARPSSEGLRSHCALAYDEYLTLQRVSFAGRCARDLRRVAFHRSRLIWLLGGSARRGVLQYLSYPGRYLCLVPRPGLLSGCYIPAIRRPPSPLPPAGASCASRAS